MVLFKTIDYVKRYQISLRRNIIITLTESYVLVVLSNKVLDL